MDVESSTMENNEMFRRRSHLDEAIKQLFLYDSAEEDDSYTNIRIIETHSTPNLVKKLDVVSPMLSENKAISDTDIFFNCVSESQGSNIECTLKDPRQLKKSPVFKTQENLKNTSPIYRTPLSELKNTPVLKTPLSELKRSPVCMTPLSELKRTPAFKTPLSELNRTPVFKTPLSELNRTSIFKTPLSELKRNSIFKTPLSELKRTPVLRTPQKSLYYSMKKKQTTKYQNIESPVAAYIKRIPIVPIIKDVYPRQPLGDISVTYSTKINKAEKENSKEKIFSKLPLVAYKCAKANKMVRIPDAKKLPDNQWSKEVESSIPIATVITHLERKKIEEETHLHSIKEESFEDLPLDQADLSLWAQKSARH